jgi:hypothetical protein
MSIPGLLRREEKLLVPASGGMINRSLNFELNAEKNLPGAFTRD